MTIGSSKESAVSDRNSARDRVQWCSSVITLCFGIIVALSCLALIPLNRAGSALSATGAGASALYPATGTVASTSSPTLSARYDSPSSTGGSVQFEVYDESGTNLVATGVGPAVAAGDRSGWKVPATLLSTNNLYRWRARADGGTSWSELFDIEIDVANGEALPATPPVPDVPVQITLTPAHVGAWITWSPANAGPGAYIDKYELRALQTSNISLGDAQRLFRFQTNGDRTFLAATMPNPWAWDWSIRAVSLYGSGPWVPIGSFAARSVPGGTANFARIAGAYLDARHRLLLGTAGTAREALVGVADSASIVSEITEQTAAELDTRAYIDRYDAGYTSYTKTFRDHIAYWSGPDAITLQAVIEEKLGQRSGVSDAGDAEYSSLHTFTFLRSNEQWILTAEATPQDAMVETTPPSDEEPVEGFRAVSLASPPSLEQTADGMLVLNPSAAQPLVEAQAVGLDYYGMAAYAHRHYKSYNKNYYRWPNDCTNFVSQAMRHGRMSMWRGWYRSDGVWWYTGSPIVRASFTWSGANNLFRHVYRTGRATFKRFFNEAAVGDLLFWDYGGDGHVDHVSIVVRRIGNNVYYAQHSDDKDNALLAEGIRRNPRVAVYVARLTG